MIYYLKYLKAFKKAYTLILPYMFSMEYVQAGGKQCSEKKTEFNILPTSWVENFIMCKCHRVSIISDWYNTGCIIMCIFPFKKNQSLPGYVILYINLIKLFTKIKFTTWFCALWMQKFSTFHVATFKYEKITWISQLLVLVVSDKWIGTSDGDFWGI